MHEDTAPGPDERELLVSVRGARKRFGATQALDDVDLDVRAGSVHALLGQNGAGKSTVIKVLAGVHALDAGEVTVCGHPLGSPGAAGAIAFIHQDLGLVPGLSVAENIALGSGYPRRRRAIDWTAVQRRAERGLALVDSDVDPRARVAELSRTERSLVAIARALVVDARVLVLDEPTASLPVDETERLFAVLRRLRDEGLGLVYVSHRLDEVFALADRATVLRDGRLVMTGPMAATTPDEVVHAIVGRTPLPPPPPPPPSDGVVLLELRDLVGERVGPVSVSVRAGEVVALVGLDGAGHVELGRTVVGASPRYGGELLVGGSPVPTATVQGAVRRGIGFVTSNRADEGLAMGLTITENLFPNPAVDGQRWYHLRRRSPERARALTLVDRYGVRPADPDLPVAGLSGGNQQKVVVGRWLSTDAQVLVLEEPTAGVDVGAKREVYALLDQALRRGLAVLLVSTDVEEVAAVCHRALVVKDGRIAAELTRAVPGADRAHGGGALDVATLVAHASGAAA